MTPKGDDNMAQINGTLGNDKQSLDVAAALQKFDRKSLAQD